MLCLCACTSSSLPHLPAFAQHRMSPQAEKPPVAAQAVRVRLEICRTITNAFDVGSSWTTDGDDGPNNAHHLHRPLFSLLASRFMNTMIVTVRRRAVMTDHGIPCVHTQNNSRAVFYAQGQFVLILVCSSRVPPPATLLQHSQNRIVSAHSRVAWECSVSSGRLN